MAAETERGRINIKMLPQRVSEYVLLHDVVSLHKCMCTGGLQLWKWTLAI